MSSSLKMCKALCYITGTNYDHVAGLRYHHDREEWVRMVFWGFFRSKAYKKGTTHFKFLAKMYGTNLTIRLPSNADGICRRKQPSNKKCT